MSAFSCLSPPTCSLSTQSAATALSLLPFNNTIKYSKSIIVKSNIEKSNPKQWVLIFYWEKVVSAWSVLIMLACGVKESVCVCVSGVRLQGVTDRATSQETMPLTEGKYLLSLTDTGSASCLQPSQQLHAVPLYEHLSSVHRPVDRSLCSCDMQLYVCGCSICSFREHLNVSITCDMVHYLWYMSFIRKICIFDVHLFYYVLNYE